MITNYRAINSKTHQEDVIKEITTADLVTCSVGPNILKFIAPVIAKGVDMRPNDATPLAVIACENAISATDMLAEHIKDPKHTPEHRLHDHHERARYANCELEGMENFYKPLLRAIMDPAVREPCQRIFYPTSRKTCATLLSRID